MVEARECVGYGKSLMILYHRKYAIARNLRKREENTMKSIRRASISMMLIVALMVTTMVPTFATDVPNDHATAHWVFDFDPASESVLDAFGRANPFIDLSEAVVTEEVDAYGNAMYFIETARREIFNSD